MHFSFYQTLEEEIPTLKLHRLSFPGYSLLHPLSHASPFLAAGCCEEDIDQNNQIRCCGHGAYRLRMFLVLLRFRAPGDTEGSFESGWHRFH